MRHSTKSEKQAYKCMLERMSDELVPRSELDKLKAENAKLRDQLEEQKCFAADFDA